MFWNAEQQYVLIKYVAYTDIDDLTPEEDIVPLGHVMTSALFPTAFYLPSYIEWLKSNDVALKGSVEYLKKYLDRHLRFDNRPWVLVR